MMEPFEVIMTTNTDRPVMVSLEDYEAVAEFRWFEKRSAAISYVARSVKSGGKVATIRLHRFIGDRMFGEQPPTIERHHKNRDPFDCRRSNIEALPRSDHRRLHRTIA